MVVCRLLLWFVGCLWLWFVWCLLLLVVVVRVGGVVVGLDHLAPAGGLPSTGPPPPDLQKIRAFFLSPATNFALFCLSLCVCSLNFGGFCEDRDPASGPPGFTQQPENSKRSHLTARRFQKPPKKTREDTQRETKKSENDGGDK